MIVCLGWGSLVWDHKCLEISGRWEPNGPEVPVEYLRQSNDGRLTLVIDEEAPKSVVLWARMRTTNMVAARENLRVREGRTKEDYIGSWSSGEPSPEDIPGLAVWATMIQANSVIWTALPAKFDGRDLRKPTYQEALTYLKELPRESREGAEKYVRKTPHQIRTPYRDLLERDFGWYPEETGQGKRQCSS